MGAMEVLRRACTNPDLTTRPSSAGLFPPLHHRLPSLLLQRRLTADPGVGCCSKVWSAGFKRASANNLGAALEAGHALEKGGSKAGQSGRLSKKGRPPHPAGNTAAGKQLYSVGTAISGDLDVLGRSVYVQGSVGSAVAAMPGNGSPLILPSFLPISASQAFDHLPVRNARSNSGYVVQVEEGEVWEKGPTTVEMDGNTIRAIFSPSSTYYVMIASLDQFRGSWTCAGYG